MRDGESATSALAVLTLARDAAWQLAEANVPDAAALAEALDGIGINWDTVRQRT